MVVCLSSPLHIPQCSHVKSRKSTCWERWNWLTGEGVEKAQLLASILYNPDIKSLRSSTILPLLENGGEGPVRRLKWSEIEGLTLSKFAVVHGLCKSRGMCPSISLSVSVSRSHCLLLLSLCCSLTIALILRDVPSHRSPLPHSRWWLSLRDGSKTQYRHEADNQARHPV